MNKKLFVSLTIVLFTIFSFTVCFANNDNGNDNGSVLGNASNSVRNVVGGVENTVENAAMGISNTSQNMTGDVENTMSGNNNNDNNNDNNNSTFMGMGTTGDNGGYTATRTATDDTTVMGMSSTAWTWLILGITAIGIIAIVWYYSMQFTKTNRHNND